jgi:transcription-repair coupling factor (superfamily II helicase)
VKDLERYFAINGYSRASTVSERGEFAIRGGVIDVYPPAAEEPVRLDLFGDTLESIRAFDPETQRSTKQLREIQLLPVSEALLDKDGVSRFRNGYIRAFGAPGDDPLYATVSEGGRRAGLEHWLPLFYERMATLFDYLPDGALVGVDHQAAESRDERLAMIADAYDARASADRKSAYRPLAPDALYLTAKPSGTRPSTTVPTASSRRSSRRAWTSSTWAPSWAAPSPPSGPRTASTCSRPPPTTPALAGPRASACCSPRGPRARPSAWGPCWPTTA